MFHDFEHNNPYISPKTGIFAGFLIRPRLRIRPHLHELQVVFRVGLQAYTLHHSWVTRIGCHRIEDGKATFVPEWKPVDANQAADTYDLLTEIQWRDGKKLTQALKAKLQKSREYLYRTLHLTPLEQVALEALKTHRAGRGALREDLLKEAANSVRQELNSSKPLHNANTR